MFAVQGRTHELTKLPPELEQGHYLVLGKNHSAMFMGCVNRNTVMWSLSSPAPQQAANDLNALFKDKASAQVMNCCASHVADSSFVAIVNANTMHRSGSLVSCAQSNSAAAIATLQGCTLPAYSSRLTETGDRSLSIDVGLKSRPLAFDVRIGRLLLHSQLLQEPMH